MARSRQRQTNAFYDACQQGDLECARKLLPTMTYEEINRGGSNDERDLCSRWKLNKKGLTAYESGQLNEIRKLFSRPSTSIARRFYDENPMISLQPKSFDTIVNTDTLSTSIPDNWSRGHTNATDAVDGIFMCSLSKAPFLLKKLLEMRTKREAQENFEKLIQTYLTDPKIKPDKREKVMRPYDEYKRTNRVELLLTIYTMDTPIYSILKNEANAFTTLVFLHIDQLASKAYTGITYRGVAMTQDEIDAYRWAQTSPNYVLETRTFQSTSKSKAMAKFFASAASTMDTCAVVFTFIFKEKCITAIDLDQIAHFSEEEEVLLFPFTLFKVEQIALDSH
ncbi:unnamed protein product, partial [Rotaria sordida]